MNKLLLIMVMMVGLNISPLMAAPNFNASIKGSNKPQHYPQQHFDKFAKKMNLSDVQKQKIQAIMQQSREKYRTVSQKQNSNIKALRTMTMSAEYNEKTVSKLADQIGSAMAEWIKFDLKNQHEIYLIFTVEQREQLKLMKKVSK